jgi:hypothetical protein
MSDEGREESTEDDAGRSEGVADSDSDGDASDVGGVSPDGRATRDAAEAGRDLADDSGDALDAETHEEDEDEDEDEWRFSLADLPSDGDGDEGGGEGIAGTIAPSERIEPGDVDPESVVFVVMGAVIAIVSLYLMLP